MFLDVKDAVYWIENIKRKEKRKDMSKMRYALDLLDNPQNAYKKIHIAGTNGKGSTTAYLKSVLMKMEYKVGTFISPYVVCFNERISINNEYISDYDLLSYTNKIYSITKIIEEKLDDIVSFFEVLTLIALLYFKDQNVDYAIIEVGLGGLLDATNVINAKASLITNISYDHMSTLGNTLEEIATNKLGILKQGNHLITTVDSSLSKLFIDYCNNINASIKIIDTSNIEYKYSNNSMLFTYENQEYLLNLPGIHQISNAVLAIQTIKYLFNSFNYPLVYAGLKNTFWPGRLEVVCKKPLIVIDGAHNIGAIDMLVKSVLLMYPNYKINILYSSLGDKQSKDILNKLTSIAQEIVFTFIPEARGKDPNILYSECNFQKKSVIENYLDALLYLKKNTKKDSLILVTGSLHLISLIRKTFFQ